MAKVALDIPDSDLAEVRRRVKAGEFADEAELVAEALRYYLQRHRPEDWDEYVRKEVAWSRRDAG